MSLNRCPQAEVQRIALTELRIEVQDILKPNHDDKFLLRWLKARKFNVSKAEQMIRESFKFRERLNADEILTNYEVPEVDQKYRKTARLGFDKGGSLVRLFMCGICDSIGYVHSLHMVELLKLFVYILESDLKYIKENRRKLSECDVGFTYIFDFEGFRMKHMYDQAVMNAAMKIVSMVQDNYPEMLKVVYIINVPSYFTWLANIMNPLLDTATLSKLKIYGHGGWRESVLKNMDADILPAFLGGTRTDPDGNPKCYSIVNWESKIPESYYVKPDQWIQGDKAGMKAKKIRPRSAFDIPVRVRQPGMVIRWRFQTKNCDIRFGLFYVGTGKKRGGEELVKVESFDCHLFSESGQFSCQRPGQYVLRFDNTYSWLTEKHLVYKVEIQDPESQN